MSEYSGYISVNPVDWGKVAKDAGQEVIDVLKNRRDERIRLDDLNNNLQAEIANYEATKSPEANEFIMAGSQTARSYIQNQNDLLKSGQITPEQYKRNIQNTQVGFKGFKVVMDTFATNIEEARKLVESGVTGKQAEWVNDVNGKMLTLKDKLMTVGTNGSLYIKDVASGDLYDVQSLTNKQNRVVKKVQLVPEVDSAVKGLGVGAKYDAASDKYVISPKTLGDWNKTKEDLANSILSSDSRVASVLADNLEGYNFTDKKKRGENEILMERDANRVWSPKLTDAQRKKARQIVMDQIEARVSYKESDDRMIELQRQRNYLAYRRSEDGGKRKIDYNKRIEQITRVSSPGGLRTAEGASILSKIKLEGYEKQTPISIEKRGDNFVFNYPYAAVLRSQPETFAILNNAFNATTGYQDVNTTDLAGFMGDASVTGVDYSKK